MKASRTYKYPLKFMHLVLFSLIFISQTVSAGIEPRIVGGVESNPAERSFMMHLKAMEPLSQGDSTELHLLSRDGAGATPYEGGLISQGDSLEFQAPNGVLLNGAFAGQMVDCGLAEAPCENAAGKVCLIQEGGNALLDKIENCESGKGLAAIIYDDQSEGFNGLGDIHSTRIPVIGVKSQDGLHFLNALDQVILGTFTGLNKCGGTLIRPDWVVTAAHCVVGIEDSIEPYPAENLKLIPGGHEITIDKQFFIADENQLSVKQVLVHQGLSINRENGLLDNDIALVQLNTPVTTGKPIDIIDLASLSAATDSGLNALVIGRGSQKPLKPSDEDVSLGSSQLFEVELPLISNGVCQEGVNQQLAQQQLPATRLTAGHLCLERPQKVRGGCHGDSGGPVVLQKEDGTLSLAGTVSQAIGCAQPDLPDLQTRTPAYAGAIDDVISGKTNEFKGKPVEATAVLEDSGSKGGGGGGAIGLLFGGVLACCRRYRVRMRKTHSFYAQCLPALSCSSKPA